MFENDYLLRAIVAGLGIAIMAGPLGSVVVWRRMSYFGDTLAHATLLGVCISFLLHVSIYVGLIAMCILVGWILSLPFLRFGISQDTLLGILSPTFLALGLIVASTIEGVRLDLLSYLFGDILAIAQSDLLWIYLCLLFTLGVLWYLWRPLLSITLHEELAAVEGVCVRRTKSLYLALLAVVFAVAMKLVGALLMTALLVIPASTARLVSRSPEGMATKASVFGAVAVIAGIYSSVQWDWPTGPGIVTMASVQFLLCRLWAAYRF